MCVNFEFHMNAISTTLCQIQSNHTNILNICEFMHGSVVLFIISFYYGSKVTDKK